MRFIFDEEREIKDAVEKFNPHDIFGTLRCLALNAVIFMGLDKNAAYDYIVGYMKNKLYNYCEEYYYDKTMQYIKSANRHFIKKIDEVQISKQEMDFVRCYEDKRKQKVTFVIIAVYEYINQVTDGNTDTIWLSVDDILKMARVQLLAKERNAFFKFVYDDGLLMPPTYMTQAAKVFNKNKFPPEDEIELYLNESDFGELAYTFLSYQYGGYKRCRMCGEWFKMNRSKPGQLYCKKHAKSVVPMETRSFVCVDCGKNVTVSSKNNMSIRCGSCQYLYRKEYFKNKRAQSK